MSLNTCAFVGRLGGDAEIRSTKSDTKLLTFSIAVDTGFGNSKKTMWIRCNLWGKRAEGKLSDYLKRGTTVGVSGSLSVSEWTAQDGTARTTLELNIADIALCGGNNNSPSSEPSYEDDIPLD